MHVNRRPCTYGLADTRRAWDVLGVCGLGALGAVYSTKRSHPTQLHACTSNQPSIIHGCTREREKKKGGAVQLKLALPQALSMLPLLAVPYMVRR
jgi:hypothetical protein